MNNSRRKSIKQTITKIETIMSLIEEVTADLQEIQTEEQDAYDNMPEGLQESERGEHMQECIDTFDEIISTLTDDIDFDDIISQLGNM